MKNNNNKFNQIMKKKIKKKLKKIKKKKKKIRMLIHFKRNYKFKKLKH